LTVTALVLALTSVALAWPWSYICGLGLGCSGLGLGLALCGLVNIPAEKWSCSNCRDVGSWIALYWGWSSGDRSYWKWS